MIYHEDDRAQRLCDIFQEAMPGVQINISYVNSTDHVTAWHMHKKQTDWMICIKGSFKVGVASEQSPGVWAVRWVYLSEKTACGGPMVIIPEEYHGYKALEPGSIMLYYTDRKYDPRDVYTKKPGEFDETWETISK